MSNSKITTIRVALIIINAKNQILLAQHRKNGKEYWVLPGGHLEYGESLFDCAARELKEETSLIGRCERLVYVSESIAPDLSRHIINFYILGSASEGEIKVPPDEPALVDVRYITLNEFENITLYPDIKKEILMSHKSGWQEQNVKYIKTSWS